MKLSLSKRSLYATRRFWIWKARNLANHINIFTAAIGDQNVLQLVFIINFEN